MVLLFGHIRIMWEHFHHQADIGVRGIADSLEEAFEQTAIAMMDVTCDPQKVAPDNVINISCRAEDTELLLVDWLNAIIYEMSTGGILFSKFAVNIEGNELTAKAWGEKVDPQKHDTAVEVKGATYHKLSVNRGPDGKWTAQCVVDV